MRRILRKERLNSSNGSDIQIQGKTEPNIQNKRGNILSNNIDNDRKVTSQNTILGKIENNNQNIPSKTKISNIDTKNYTSNQYSSQKSYGRFSNYSFINNKKK